ncbi:MAG TPA: EB domain-containing protein [Polyangiales bacterium]|nr:EB domain-containing protein [Polyangiales bacterium]
MKLKYLVLVSMLAVLACEEDKEPRTHEQFCRDWAAAACTEETVSACQASSPEECRQSQEDFCRDLVPSKGFSDQFGDVCIDAVGAAYEDADLEDEEIATVLRLGEPCDKLIAGEKERGESCDSNTDCDAPAGYVCVMKSDKATGTCEIPQEVEAGRDCSAAQKTCPSGFFCNGDNCVESRDVGDACKIQEECGDTAYCDKGKCAARVGVNGTCREDYECESGICYEYDGKKSCTDRIRLARAEPICEDLR